LALGDWDIPVYAIEGVMPHNKYGRITADASVDHVVQEFPDADLIVIEGLQGLMPNTGRGQTQNKAELNWMIDVRDRFLNNGKTIIATTHSPKAIEKSKHKRENFLGSQALIGACGTMVSFDLPEGQN